MATGNSLIKFNDFLRYKPLNLYLVREFPSLPYLTPEGIPHYHSSAAASLWLYGGCVGLRHGEGFFRRFGHIEIPVRQDSYWNPWTFWDASSCIQRNGWKWGTRHVQLEIWRFRISCPQMHCWFVPKYVKNVLRYLTLPSQTWLPGKVHLFAWFFAETSFYTCWLFPAARHHLWFPNWILFMIFPFYHPS